MIGATIAAGSRSGLMGEYAALLEDAVLMQRVKTLEATCRIKAELVRQFQAAVVEVVSEESGAPLTTLVDFTSWIGRQAPETISDGDVERYAYLIGGAAERLLASVDQLLAHSLEISQSLEPHTAREVGTTCSADDPIAG